MALGDNLVIVYSLNDSDLTSGNPDDLSGEGNDGTTVGATSGSSGINDECFSFDGSNDYVDTNYQNATLGDYSFVFWFKSSDSSADYCFGFDYNTGSRNYLYGIKEASGVFTVQEKRSGGTHRAISGTTNIRDGSWHMIAVTSSQNGTLTLYVDGSSEGTPTATDNAVLVVGRDLWLGSTNIFSGAPGNPVAGDIDEFLFFERAISSSEVSELWNSGSGTFFPFTSLTVTSPNGGEYFVVGRDSLITWSDSGSVSDVKLEYSTNNGGAYSDIVASVSNTGSYSWSVPDDVSSNCLVRVSDALDSGNSDVSDAVFTIGAGPDTVVRGGSFVQSWLVYVDSIISGAILRVREFSNVLIREYVVRSPHVQITGDFRAEVVKVHDADTVTLRASFRDFDFPLRIANIDALELNDGGHYARDWLEKRILGKTVDVLINPDNRVGKYGRLVGELFVDGFNVGDRMMREYLVSPFGEKRHRIEPLSKIFARAGYQW